MQKIFRNNTESFETFDAVMLCTGHHAYPHIPKFQSQHLYQGKVIHSQEYKDYRGFEDQTVVVVGIGNSGGDIAAELSRVCKEVIRNFFYKRKLTLRQSIC